MNRSQFRFQDMFDRNPYIRVNLYGPGVQKGCNVDVSEQALSAIVALKGIAIVRGLHAGVVALDAT